MWFVTFRTFDAAKRAEKVFSMRSCLLDNREVIVSAHAAPVVDYSVSEVQGQTNALRSKDEGRIWQKDEIVIEAEKLIMNELQAVLEKDITERVIGVEIRRMAADERGKRDGEQGKIRHQADVLSKDDHNQERAQTNDRLKGLSFRKRKQEEKAKVVARLQVQSDTEDDGGHERLETFEEKRKSANSSMEERPAKRVKSQASSALASDIESEDEVEERATEKEQVIDNEQIAIPLAISEHDLATESPSPTVTAPPDPEPALSDNLTRKRSPSPVAEHREAKRMKIAEDRPIDVLLPEHVPVPVPEKRPAKKAERKKPTKKSKAKGTPAQENSTLEIFIPPTPLQAEVPSVAEVHVTLAEVSPSPVINDLPLSIPPVQQVLPLSEKELRLICDDDEDLYFAHLAITTAEDEELALSESAGEPAEEPVDSPAKLLPRKNETGSARTEGYRKIELHEKSEYVAQYAARSSNKSAEPAKKQREAPKLDPVASSRSNRANARRRALGLDEINQVQLAVALSKGETGTTEVVKFNQLQTRKKNLRFARSPIHAWGLYAMERILKGEMVIEYVGEVIRAAVADKREKAYERQGIGSSYLFRINEDLVVDATKKGNLG